MFMISSRDFTCSSCSMVTVVVTGHSSRRSTPPRWTPTGNGLQRGQFCWPPLGKTVDRQRAATWPPLGRISWPCGAGMRGPERGTPTIGAAETGDLQGVRGGRLAVLVRGRNARLVPIRECWTPAVRQAVSLVSQRSEPCDRFIISTDRNACGCGSGAARAANSVSIGSARMSLRRARATWLTAHLLAETPLVVLRRIAGPLSAATLDDLLAATGHTVSPEQAVIKGLRA